MDQTIGRLLLISIKERSDTSGTWHLLIPPYSYNALRFCMNRNEVEFYEVNVRRIVGSKGEKSTLFSVKQLTAGTKF